MHKVISIKVVSMLIMILLPSLTMLGGWVITEESTDGFGNKTLQTTFIDGNLIRHETISSLAIIDLEDKEITIIFSQYRVYWRGTITELKQSTVEAYDKQMSEMVAGLPESISEELDSLYLDIRNQLLDTTIQFNDSSININETNDIDTLLGYACRKYDIMVDSTLSETIWHTSAIKPYSELNIKNMLAFMKQMKSISGGSNISHSIKYIGLLKSGLLLKSKEIVNDTVFQTVEVTNIREVAIPANFFDPPPGYREVSIIDILNLMPVITDDLEEPDRF